MAEGAPTSIEFTPSLNEVQSQTFTVSNPLVDKYLVFKLQCTAPSRYRILPSTGIIDPRTECKFTVSLNLSKDPPSQQQREVGSLADKLRFQTKAVSQLPKTDTEIKEVLAGGGLSNHLISVNVTLPEDPEEANFQDLPPSVGELNIEPKVKSAKSPKQLARTTTVQASQSDDSLSFSLAGKQFNIRMSTLFIIVSFLVGFILAKIL
eukprot:TRINITY_DN15631_c0_g1_i1.p1 TRINITY_DN15631_c0_g1~~TRINITY_DN15631_c0_g1_i1.p1  ORF type:complete len:217 (-),score=34.66 TRINITY_DN15631_c0_g1_i1:37-657(-)